MSRPVAAITCNREKSMAFGPWIRAEREKAEIGLNDFAKLIGISPAYWSRIERGMEKAPKDNLIVAACKQLGWETTEAKIVRCGDESI